MVDKEIPLPFMLSLSCAALPKFVSKVHLFWIRIMLHQRNRQIHSRQGFVGSLLIKFNIGNPFDKLISIDKLRLNFIDLIDQLIKIIDTYACEVSTLSILLISSDLFIYLFIGICSLMCTLKAMFIEAALN